MAHLVRDHALQFFPVEGAQQSLGDRDRGMLRITAGGERIGVVIGNDIRRRHREARGDRHFLDDIFELLAAEAIILGAGTGQPRLERFGLCRGQDGAITVAQRKPRRPAAEGECGERPDRHIGRALADHEQVESRADGGEDQDEDNHHLPGAPAVCRLLFEEIHDGPIRPAAASRDRPTARPVRPRR